MLFFKQISVCISCFLLFSPRYIIDWGKLSLILSFEQWACGWQVWRSQCRKWWGWWQGSQRPRLGHRWTGPSQPGRRLPCGDRSSPHSPPPTPSTNLLWPQLWDSSVKRSKKAGMEMWHWCNPFTTSTSPTYRCQNERTKNISVGEKIIIISSFLLYILFMEVNWMNQRSTTISMLYNSVYVLCVCVSMIYCVWILRVRIWKLYQYRKRTCFIAPSITLVHTVVD